MDQESVGGVLLLFAALVVCGLAVLAVGYQVMTQPRNESAPQMV